MLKTHPIASPFPVLTGAEMKAIERDIKANGLLHPIVVFEGQILDGRTRYQACYHIKHTLTDDDFVQFPGTWDEAMTYVVSVNLARRHLTESQRAWVANKLAQIPRPGTAEAAQICASSPSMPARRLTQSEAAKQLQVSRMSVQHARKVDTKGVEELGKAVMNGVMKVSAAAKVADLPADAQRAAVKESTKAQPRKTVRAKAPRPPKPEPSNEDKLVTQMDTLLDLAEKFVAADGPVNRVAVLDAVKVMRLALDRIEAVASVTEASFSRLLADG